MDDVFKAIKPILNKTVNWRTNGFKRFWTAALKYAYNGEIPVFENQRDSHLDDTFEEFKAIIDKYKSVGSKKPSPSPAPETVDYYEKLLDILSYESDFFTDVERAILIDMLKQSRNRDKYFYNTPFIYTTTRVVNMGFDYKLFYQLRNKLDILDVVTFEKKSTEKYEFEVTFYVIDEKKLYEFLTKKVSRVG